MQQEPQNLIDIPTITNQDMFESNRERAYSKNLDHCPCCGKAITNPKYFINSIFGGMAYPSSDNNNYNDSWMMGVGSECRKKFPNGYVFTINK
jgi:hypothetical protein